MNFNFKIFLFFLICTFTLALQAQVTKVTPAATVKPATQVKEKKLVQFSGIVVSGDSLEAVPFANVTIKGTTKGTVSDYTGFFSFVAEAGDQIEFSALGYKTVSFKLADTLKSSRYSWIQVLSTDTIYLSEAVIVPWPSMEAFKKVFVETVIPNDDMQRARKNLDVAAMKERLSNEPMDAGANYTNFVNQRVATNYYNGQFRPNNLLNPFAWAQFIKAWKQGKFKQKK